MTLPALLLTISVELILASLVPYLIYLVGILFGKKMQPAPVLTEYPPISIVMSAYNEEANIERRLVNIRSCNYPGSVEIVFVDDKSSDNTGAVAKKWLDVLGFSYHIIYNNTRKGTSASYNLAIRNTVTDIVVITDADVLFGKSALTRIVDRLNESSVLPIGAVSGDLQPTASFKSNTAVMEQQYRSVYGDMCAWESAHDSTFNFNGGLMAFRKSAINWINQSKGADDANIAFAVIRNGYRAVYEAGALVLEEIPASMNVQFRQKARRAKGLLEATLSNLDLLSSGRPFSWFYAARIWMLLASPMFFVTGFGLFVLANFLSSTDAGIIMVGIVLIVLAMSSFVRAFIVNQVYLVAGLFSRKNAQVWESTSSVEKGGA